MAIQVPPERIRGFGNWKMKGSKSQSGLIYGPIMDIEPDYFITTHVYVED